MKKTYKTVMNDMASASFQENQAAYLDKVKNQAKYYIFLQGVLDSLREKFAPDEVIETYLALSNASNPAMTSTGWMGMGYARKEKAREYVNIFNDTRGNRLLVFTNQRMIYLTLLDYLEEDRYASFAYDKIKGIRFKEKKLSYWDFSAKSRKQVSSYYLVDFQAENRIFSETLDEQDARVFRDQLENIPLLNKVKIDDCVHRSNHFDYFFSNPSFWYKLLFILLTVIPITFFVVYIILVLLGIYLDVGPLKEMFDFSN